MMQILATSGALVAFRAHDDIRSANCAATIAAARHAASHGRRAAELEQPMSTAASTNATARAVYVIGSGR
jgi:hypothetical protein